MVTASECLELAPVIRYSPLENPKDYVSNFQKEIPLHQSPASENIVIKIAEALAKRL